MNRSQIRRALYLLKAGTELPEATAIWAQFQQQVAEMGLTIYEFAEDWDISQKEPFEIVGRSAAQKFKAQREGSLFTNEGSLKE